MTRENPMLAGHRRERICELVGARGECTVAELAHEFGVSGMTIRRDLEILREEGKIARTHGGATKPEWITFEFAFLYHARENPQAKEAIATAAARLVPDYASVLLDSGTTTLAMARQLRCKSALTIVTTSLPIAAELQHEAQIRVLVLGGYLRPAAPDLFGAITEANLELLHTEWAFLGADAVDETGAVYNRLPEVGRLLQKMAVAAERVYVLADHTKLGRRALARFGSLAGWAGLITDDGADPAVVAALRGAGVNVLCAPVVLLEGPEKGTG